MNLRIKLLLSFSFTAFTALFLFGLVAYDTALEESEKNESRLIFTILQDELRDAATALKTNSNFTDVIQNFENKNKLLFHITDDQKRVVYTSPELTNLPQIDLKTFPIKKIDRDRFEINNHEYHWQKLVIPKTPYTLTAFYHHNPDETNSFFIQMALSLTITAFIVIWFAAWSAIYIASLLEKLKLQKEELEKLATHDTLTGLPNRLLLMDRIEQAILLADREKHHFAICFIDLDKFKQINDSLGHSYGDEVLQQIAHRLDDSVRKSDTVARLGGDELAVILNRTDKQGAEIVVEKLIDAIEEPMLFNAKEFKISASIGIAMYPRHGKSATMLIKNADDAMYVAKKAGHRFQHADNLKQDDPSDKKDTLDFGPSIPKPV